LEKKRLEDPLKVSIKSKILEFEVDPGSLDMDVIFALAHTEGVSPVAVSLRKDIPSAGTPEANRILGFPYQTETEKS